MADATKPPMPNPVVADLMHRQQTIEAALGEVIKLLKDSGGVTARAMTGTSFALFAVVELLIRKELVTSGEAIASIDGMMAERFGEQSDRIEQSVVDQLLKLLQELKATGR